MVGSLVENKIRTQVINSFILHPWRGILFRLSYVDCKVGHLLLSSPAGIYRQTLAQYFRAYLWIFTPFFCISATNARQFFKSRTSPPPCQGIVVLFQVLTSLSGSEIWHCSTPATAVTLVFDWMMLESWEKLISVNTTLAVAPLSWSNSQWYHGTIIELK